MVLLQGIAWTVEQQRQLIKRMEPLTEENEKLKEMMKLMEINVQRDNTSRILPNPMRDLEYQKGVLSDQLAPMSEQLQGRFE